MDALLLLGDGQSVANRGAIGSSLELAIPLNRLGAHVAFAVIVERELNGERVTIERHPESTAISFDVPTPDFDARHWRA